MNKTELVAAMAEKTELSKKDAEKALSLVKPVLYDQLFQLNGHGLRVKANVEIFRGDILDLTADAADRRVTFMYRQ